ncbi:hypothetical protein QVD99_000214 [Batrachochytrium dendrobatidis]|nr:hypothetical protein QVD99_000214 [Batrachochytrium dendrobatidis]
MLFAKSIGWKAILFASFGLSAIAAPNTPHTISITMDVDDSYSLTFDGTDYSVSYSDSSWYTIKTYTKNVTGDGPWLIAVHANDYGTIAGLFASVFLDGSPYSTTATANNKFVMSPNTPSTNWNTNINYDDSQWFTQTTDNCPITNMWSSMLPSLDQQTKGQVARSMWYPDCRNTGTVANPKNMYFRLLVTPPPTAPTYGYTNQVSTIAAYASAATTTSPAAVVTTTSAVAPIATHVITITAVVDDYYEMKINSVQYTVPQNETNWKTLQTYNQVVYGDGPWLISITGHDTGGASGLFAAVYIDGKPFTFTGSTGNKFVMIGNTPAQGWDTNVNFDDRAWYTQTSDSCNSVVIGWPFISTLDAMTRPQLARAMWYPDCTSTPGNSYTPRNMYFRLVVTAPTTAPTSIPAAQVSTTSPAAVATTTSAVAPIATHVITITMVVDDYYEMKINSVQYTVPQNSTNWKTLQTYNQVVYGDGPWLISITGHDTGGASGLFAAVYIDGKPFTFTGSTGNKFVMLGNTPAQGWDTNVSFDDRAWYTQTSDVCNSLSDPWWTFIPTLDAMTRPQLARAMWYPDCTSNLGSTNAPKNMYFRLVVTAPTTAPTSMPVAQVSTIAAYVSAATTTSPAAVATTTSAVAPIATHVITITMVVDDYYEMKINSVQYTVPQNSTNWKTLQTYNQVVYGDGPWLISITGHDTGGASGLFAAVYIDGKPFTFTGSAGNKFVMLGNTPAQGWDTNVNFDDRAWYTQTSDVCNSLSDPWWTFIPTLDAMTRPQLARAMWYPDCTSTPGDSYTPRNMYFRLVVTAPTTAPTSIPVAQVSTTSAAAVATTTSPAAVATTTSAVAPIATHVITITMVVDDYYEMKINSVQYTVPQNSTNWKTLQTYNQVVYGDGPWLISITGHDTGGASGLFAAVYIDGKPFTFTGSAGNKFVMLGNTPAQGWDTNVSFDDRAWYTQTSDVCNSLSDPWWTFIPTLDAMTRPQLARAMWYPDCTSNLGSTNAPKNMYFRLVVTAPTTAPTSMPVAQVSTTSAAAVATTTSPAAVATTTSAVAPIATHVITITMVVDDYYEMKINSVQYTVPQNSTNWKTLQTYNQVVYGDGPWLISITGHDTGGASGLFAAVYIDGKPFTFTGSAGNKFVMLGNTPAQGWDTNVSFDDRAWYTQTSDVCNSLSDPWWTFIPTLDAMTRPQLARAMWYPDCTSNLGSTNAPKNMYFRLVVTAPTTAPTSMPVAQVSTIAAYVSAATTTSPAAVATTTSAVAPIATHVITITMDVDDSYSLTFDGTDYSVSYSDSSWYTIKTYTKNVTGNGPWLIAVHANDYGTIAGLFASVFLDGSPYSTTATANNKFVMSPNTPSTNWNTNINYDDSQWFTQTTDNCPITNMWNSMLPSLDQQTKGQVARSMWYPDCRNTGTVANPKNMYFRLVVTAPTTAPTSIPVAQVSTTSAAAVATTTSPAAVATTTSAVAPIATHVITITMVVDDYYEMKINSVQYTVPQNSTNWKTLQTYNQVVYGDGPWLISITGHDTGGASGLFAAVYIDGKPFTFTGSAGNKFVMLGNTPAQGWDTNVSFDDRAWYTQTSDVCNSLSDPWWTFIPTLDAMTRPQLARAMWYPDCTSNLGSTNAPKNMYFRLVVTAPTTGSITATTTSEDCEEDDITTAIKPTSSATVSPIPGRKYRGRTRPDDTIVVIRLADPFLNYESKNTAIYGSYAPPAQTIANYRP